MGSFCVRLTRARSRMKTGLIALFVGASAEVEQQGMTHTCLDSLTGSTYAPGDTWLQDRIFQQGPTAGMTGKFSCTCADSGAITCRSMSLPCIYAAENKGYEIGETFYIKNYGDSHVDFKCKCEGEANGRISCAEHEPGCWDRHTAKKYKLGESFNQTREGDDLIRNCTCSGDNQKRLISCKLDNYCQLNGKYIKVGEEAVIETETQIQTCTCQEASRTSCIIEAKPVTKTVEQDQVKTQEIDA